MKKILATIFAILLFANTRAQAPLGIPYQAAARHANGQSLTNTLIKVRFSILDSISTGAVAYKETHTTTTNTLGMFNLNVGMGVAITGTFSNINWINNSKFLKVELDTTATGNNYMVMGVQQFMSVPYSLNGLPKVEPGNMLYFDGINWKSILAGRNGQYLKWCNDMPIWGACIPTVNTNLVNSITSNFAFVESQVISDGGSNISKMGICYGLNNNPTILDSTINFGTGGGVGAFTCSLFGLTPNTKYYVRAFATNTEGTSYGTTISFTTLPPNVGDSYQGGIVAYLLINGDAGYSPDTTHGIIITSNDISTSTIWGNSFNIGTTSTAFGTGNTNTNNIVAILGSGNCVAGLCYDLVLNGYSDWYLPSIGELNKIYINRNTIGGFPNAYYWSSSENGNTYAWMKNLFDGSSGNGNKTSSFLRVRAVRSF